MRNWSIYQRVYLIIFIVCVFVLGVGTTYAYWTATTNSADNAVNTQSTIFSINMELLPLYNDFSFIPMNNEDAVKALSRGCKDKYDRGACAAYTMRVFDFDESLKFISGYMDITTNNMTNLSYMMFRESDSYDEDSCVNINEKNYCVVKEATHMGDGVGLSLGDEYDVYGMDSTNFILLIWLTNLKESQNVSDIGSFNAVVTMQAGNGGKIQGVISSAVKVEDENNNNTENNGSEEDLPPVDGTEDINE